MSSAESGATERWRPVAGCEGAYEVSDAGRVRSLYRIITRGDGQRQRVRGRILSASPATDGRLRVGLHLPAGTRTRPVHILVLTAFVGPCPPGMEGCHWDDDFTNNRLSNLRWDTRESNFRDRSRNGIGRRDICSRGHRRVEPNLRGGACRACSLAYGSAFLAENRPRLAEFGKEALVALEADRHYRLIMGARPPSVGCEARSETA